MGQCARDPPCICRRMGTVLPCFMSNMLRKPHDGLDRRSLGFRVESAPAQGWPWCPTWIAMLTLQVDAEVLLIDTLGVLLALNLEHSLGDVFGGVKRLFTDFKLARIVC